MKGRDSGMPEPSYWESFFDAGAIIEALGCASLPGDIVEFGCGYGTFTLPLARQTKGTVHGFDIDPEMVACVTRETARLSLDNIVAEERDFMQDGTGLPDSSVAHVMVFNILHIEEPLVLLREARRILRPGHRLSIIHWRNDIETPRGPPLHIRPSPEQCIAWAASLEFHDFRVVDLAYAAPWHFGLTLAKPP